MAAPYPTTYWIRDATVVKTILGLLEDNPQHRLAALRPLISNDDVSTYKAVMRIVTPTQVQEVEVKALISITRDPTFSTNSEAGFTMFMARFRAGSTM